MALLLISLGLLALIILEIIITHKEGVPVLLYHQVNPLVNVKPEHLEAQFKIIVQKGINTFTASEAQEYIRQNRKLPNNSLLITIDDGYYDNYQFIFPLLKKYNIKATIFLNTAYLKEGPINRTGFIIQQSDQANYDAVKCLYENGNGQTDQYMSWSEIREMLDSGLVDFQAHTHLHRTVFSEMKLSEIVNLEHKQINALHLYAGKAETGFPILKNRGETSCQALLLKPEFFYDFQQNIQGLNHKEAKETGKAFIKAEGKKYIIGKESAKEMKERITQEMSTNKHLIELHLQRQVQHFAWPWGHHSKSGKKIIKELGFSGFYTCIKGTNALKMNFSKIRRVELKKSGSGHFKFMLFILQNRFLGTLYGLFS